MEKQAMLDEEGLPWGIEEWTDMSFGYRGGR